jgi:hypothetical protein
MTPRQQRDALLNATIGEPGHPDDYALRRAANDFLKQVLTDETTDALSVLRDFVGAYLNNIALVELMQQLNDGRVDAKEAVNKEREIKAWVIARLRKEQFKAEGGLIQIEQFRQTAARLVQAAVKILRAR